MRKDKDVDTIDNQAGQKQEYVCRVERELLSDGNNNVQPWRVFKILAEFVSGFELLQKYGLAASFFGSAKCNAGAKVYEQAEELAGKLSRAGFTIITGGSSGVMEAANKGAYEAKGQSVGMNIRLPEKQIVNKYVTDSEHFNHFFTRKVMLAFASEVYIFLPGGFGTLDEFFEMATLVQTRKIKMIPMILIGKEYWTPLLEWIRTTVFEKNHAISEKDMSIYHLVDSVDEAFDLIINLVEECRPEK